MIGLLDCSLFPYFPPFLLGFRQPPGSSTEDYEATGRPAILTALEAIAFPASSRSNVRRRGEDGEVLGMCLGMTECWIRGQVLQSAGLFFWVCNKLEEFLGFMDVFSRQLAKHQRRFGRFGRRLTKVTTHGLMVQWWIVTMVGKIIYIIAGVPK